MIIDIYYTEFLTLFWFTMLVNEYRLENQLNRLITYTKIALTFILQ
jgi:hypothetical protein